MAILALGSGFSLIFSMMKSWMRRMPSTEPEMRQTRSDVPAEAGDQVVKQAGRRGLSQDGPLTRIEVAGFRHLDPGAGVLLQLGNRLAALANDGTGRHGWHQHLQVVAGASDACGSCVIDRPVDGDGADSY